MGTDTYTFTAFNTTNTIFLEGFEGDCAQVFTEVEQQCRMFERLFSHTRPDSSLVRINRARGASVEVEEELAEVIRLALMYSERTNGLFDITIEGVAQLWDFKKGHVPSKAAIAEALQHVGFAKVRARRNSIQLADEATRLVLGGIAKGYIADALCVILAEEGVHHAFVNLGGNVKVMGGHTDGRLWNIGLRAPVSTREQPERAFATVQLFDGAVVTSGIYERAFVANDGAAYHHILDPRSGYPAKTDLVSATLVCPTALEAEGFSTALVIMGAEAALRFVEDISAADAVLVDVDNCIHTTAGIGSRIPYRLLVE